MTTVLVTGGAGYIGSHAALALAAAGCDVVVYDDLSAGHVEAVDAVRRAHPSRRVTLLRGDVRDEGGVADALSASKADAVMHFAARLSVEESVRQPVAYYQTNVTGALAVLSAMAACRVRRFVFSSTAAVFGEPQQETIDETHPTRPVNPYGETKLAVERALPHFAAATGLQWIALRYFNAAGADPEGRLGEDHDPEPHLIPRAIHLAASGRPLPVFGTDYPTPDGTCVRDYVHVSDLADAHVRALEVLTAGGPSGAYNLGNGEGTSVRQVAEAVGRAVGRPLALEAAPRRAGDPSRLVASGARARRELGWQPARPAIGDIVGSAWRWMAAHPGGYREGGA